MRLVKLLLLIVDYALFPRARPPSHFVEFRRQSLVIAFARGHQREQREHHLLIPHRSLPSPEDTNVSSESSISSEQTF